MLKMSLLTLYTDGSCSPNPGSGGWGFVGLIDGKEIHVSGGKDDTTNNVMELTAVIEGLDYFRDHMNVHIYTDSTYVMNCGKGVWKRAKNVELWRKFDIVSKNRRIQWTWVKAHNGDKYNEIDDQLAKKEMIKNKKS